ncbi:acyltransferase family protein [Novosphingobium malaysiense]|uniref:acyltransferase family protein n=1 Tax=Novosphingobium malaysiense TaxID=1348853 RepID=UPI000A3DEFF7|nr:acyltransferase family protein [Novosphingobium malaysiense]
MPSSHAAPAYRPDIDGLRAIAVLSVLLFHLDHAILPGGFAGVDVFFVISGYLITTIISREIAEGGFTILGFYERRLRRIYPALLAVLLAVSIVGMAIFTPDDLRDLGAAIVASIAFSSNLLFWHQTDYFATPAEMKPLLHTWSLAVEEQFYIGFPPLLLLLNKWARDHVKQAVLVVLGISFACSCLWAFIDPSGNYYLPHTRAWELMIGSVLALDIVPRIRDGMTAQIVAAAGILALMVPFFLLDENAAFPAWNAIATTVGTAAIIHAGRNRRTLVGRVLSVRPMVGIGLISYSLYLVHWPIISFTQYMLLREPTLAEKVAIFAASIALGWASWRFVERPFRSRRRFSRKFIFSSAFAGSSVFGLVGLAAFATQGLPQRFGDLSMQLARDDQQTVNTKGCFLKEGFENWRGKECFLTTEGDGPTTLLWGDSHANHYAGSIMEGRGGVDGPVLLFASAGCAPIRDTDFPMRPHCRANNDHVGEIIDRFDIDRVVLSAYWERVLDENGIGLGRLAKTVAWLESKGVDVALIGDNPDFAMSNPQFLQIRLAGRNPPVKDFYAPVRNSPGYNSRLKAAAGADEFYNPYKPLCRDGRCLAYRNGNLLMRDNSHFAGYGADLILKEMKPFATPE